jgi:hypothetical protein
MRKSFIIILSLSLTLASCSDYSTERKQVSDLIEQVEADQIRLKRLSPDSLPMVSADITSRLSKISGDYNERGEFIGKELGLMLADFKVYTKVFKGLPQKRMKLQEELDLSAKQLQNLDRDLKERALTADKIKKYLDDEQLAVKTTSASLDDLDTLMARGSRGYLRMVPKIDSVISSLGSPSE